MKKNIIRYISYLTCLVFVGLVVGCDDSFITRPPLDRIVDANFYTSSNQVLAASAPLYNIVWFGYNSTAAFGLGDGRGGAISTSYSEHLENTQFRTTGITRENTNAWRAFYNIVGQSNTLINNIKKFSTKDVPENIKEHAIAEARFMRGLAYSYLVQNYGEVPIITDNVSLLQDTSISRHTIASIWEFICRDIGYGTTHLPETPVQTGRLTKWSAYGMLAKMYLTRAGVGALSSSARNQVYLDSAKYLAKEVIDKSGATLMNDYEELFKMKNNNNPESLFSLQWVYDGANYGSQNSVQAYLAFSGSITGFSDGWGGDLGASLYILSKYQGLIATGNTPDKRRRATFMFPGDYYSYITNQVLDENGNPIKEPLTVPVGTSGYNGRANMKKYVVGRPEDNEGKVAYQRTGINTYMLRLSEVYLIYAEAIMGNSTTTQDPEAIKYFNMVRKRAGVTEIANGGVLSWENIFDERHVEFAAEGILWYDFVRLWYYNPQSAYDRLSSQDRGFTRITPDKFPNPTKWTVAAAPDGPARTYVVNESNFRLPIPEAELGKAPNLRKEPVTYNFN